jgi:hypothetical protein
VLAGRLRRSWRTRSSSQICDPLLAAHYEHTFALEFALADACAYRRNTGRLPFGGPYDLLFSFAVPAMRIHQKLPLHARRPFEGKLQDLINGPFGGRPLAYEINMATHLMDRGWDVEFADYGGTAQCDFLARKDHVELEIECKTTSGDTGRKIHQQEVNRLGDLLTPVTRPALERRGCHFLKITLPDRLGKTPCDLKRIVELTVAAPAAGRAEDETGDIDYWHEDCGFPEPRGDHSKEAKAFFEAKLGVRNCNLLFHGRPGHAIAAISITSRKADKVVAALSSEAKEAAKQCSGTRPAIVAMQLIDPIDHDTLSVMLRTANGLHTIAHAVFKNETRAYVDSIAFTTPQELRAAGPGASRRSAPVVVLHNDKATFPTAVPRSVFRAN